MLMNAVRSVPERRLQVRRAPLPALRTEIQRAMNAAADARWHDRHTLCAEQANQRSVSSSEPYTCATCSA